MSAPLPRRDILKAGISATALASVLPLLVESQTAFAGSSQTVTATAGMAKALRSIGGNVCLEAAIRLEGFSDDAERFSLHLRQAGLDQADARRLAAALSAFEPQKISAITSFSVSFNPDIGDAGAKVIANALPTKLPELGLVGCDIGDQAGDALLRWALRAPNLHTMCIEGNRFSDRLQARFAELGRQRPDMLLVI